MENYTDNRLQRVLALLFANRRKINKQKSKIETLQTKIQKEQEKLDKLQAREDHTIFTMDHGTKATRTIN